MGGQKHGQGDAVLLVLKMEEVDQTQEGEQLLKGENTKKMNSLLLDRKEPKGSLLQQHLDCRPVRLMLYC